MLKEMDIVNFLVYLLQQSGIEPNELLSLLYHRSSKVVILEISILNIVILNVPVYMNLDHGL